MALALNLSPTGRFGVPRGYPFTLSVQGETFAAGVVPKGAVSVTATVKAVLGTTPTGTGAAAVANTVVGAPNVYLALFSAPQTSGGADGAEVAGTRATVTGLANTGASLTTAIPSTSSTAPIPYIVRLWVDGLTGTNGVQVTDMVMA